MGIKFDMFDALFFIFLIFKWESMGYELWILTKYIKSNDGVGLRRLWFYR